MQNQQNNSTTNQLTREVLIGNQPVHVQVLQGNTAQVIKYEINIPQEGQQIEWSIDGDDGHIYPMDNITE